MSPLRCKSDAILELVDGRAQLFIACQACTRIPLPGDAAESICPEAVTLDELRMS
jgi:hypothetical protein